MPQHESQPAATRELGALRRELAPEVHEAFDRFSDAVFAEGALGEKTKQLIAVAVAHSTQCAYCIEGHTKLAHRSGGRSMRRRRPAQVAG